MYRFVPSPLGALAAILLLIGDASMISEAAIAPTAAKINNNLGQVVAGMTAQGCEELTTACFLTSRSVTRVERQYVTEQLVGAAASSSEEDGTATATSTTTAMGNAERALVVTQPMTTADIAQATMAAGGNVIYCPSRIDLARQEGLMESLGPAMQVIVSQGLQASLWVVVDDPVMARQQLASSMEAILPRLVTSSSRPLTTLEDVFTSVRYVTPAQALETLTTERNAATEVASRVAIASKTSGSSNTAKAAAALAPADLATARLLGPLARRVTADAVATVHAQCRDENGMPVRVADFGQLAQAAMQAAKQEMSTAVITKNSPLATQMMQAALAQLEFTLQADFETQVQLLSEETFQAFRKSLSKCIIGPNLAADMQAVAQTHVSAFGRQVRRLVAPSATSWTTKAAVAALQTKLRETITTRLATARASGKFKPLPRKGVTIGLHWLLPKPFGNDYRQEPWLVHAADNLVYVPADKVTEVSPEAVAAGEDWRNQIVPSPVGNDMIFMQ